MRRPDDLSQRGGHDGDVVGVLGHQRSRTRREGGQQVGEPAGEFGGGVQRFGVWPVLGGQHFGLVEYLLVCGHRGFEAVELVHVHPLGRTQHAVGTLYERIVTHNP